MAYVEETVRSWHSSAAGLKWWIDTAKCHRAVILKATPKRRDPEIDRLIWQHGRHNFALRAAGLLLLSVRWQTARISGGIAIFGATMEKAKEMPWTLNKDRKDGILTYEAHPYRGFPGWGLP